MIDEYVLSEQMSNARIRDGRWERNENGEWVPWPVLKLDKWGKDETTRVLGRHREKEATRGLAR